MFLGQKLNLKTAKAQSAPPVIATSIRDILVSPRDVTPPGEADTAIFYSISNCQDGLAGISFGAFLIKQVASDLQSELPGLRTFSTLSPVPGFARWAADRGMPADLPETDPDALGAAVAVYLAEAKTAAGLPLDPVARFHLGNGAELHRINPGADRSPRGRSQSHGAMVNYLYELDRVEARHEAFAAGGDLAVSRAVRSALGRAQAWTRSGGRRDQPVHEPPSGSSERPPEAKETDT